MGITQSTRNEIIAMYQEGYTTGEIAEAFGIPEVIVVNVLGLK